MRTLKTRILAISCVLLSTQALGASLVNPPDKYAPESFEATGSIYIEKLDFGGSGCSSANSSGELFDTNNDGFPDQFGVLFSNYIAQQGPGISLAQRRRNCNILVQLHLPQGFQFSIAEVKYDGYADLPTGVSGEQESVYQFPLFSPSTATFRTRIKGPYTENYERLDTLGVASLVWSPCGVSAPMNIRTQVALTGISTLPAMMTLDQILGRVRQLYSLEWRKCTS